jgi:hypothetical protein
MARKSKPFMCPLAPGEGSSPPKLNPVGVCIPPNAPALAPNSDFPTSPDRKSVV